MRCGRACTPHAAQGVRDPRDLLPGNVSGATAAILAEAPADRRRVLGHVGQGLGLAEPGSDPLCKAGAFLGLVGLSEDSEFPALAITPSGRQYWGLTDREVGGLQRRFSVNRRSLASEVVRKSQALPSASRADRRAVAQSLQQLLPPWRSSEPGGLWTKRPTVFSRAPLRSTCDRTEAFLALLQGRDDDARARIQRARVALGGNGHAIGTLATSTEFGWACQNLGGLAVLHGGRHLERRA